MYEIWAAVLQVQFCKDVYLSTLTTVALMYSRVCTATPVMLMRDVTGMCNKCFCYMHCG